MGGQRWGKTGKYFCLSFLWFDSDRILREEMKLEGAYCFFVLQDNLIILSARQADQMSVQTLK